MGKLVKDLVKMSKTSFVKEHKHLTKTLKQGLQGKKTGLRKELKEQSGELKKVMRGGK
jgi:hypothetical protein